MEKSTDRILLFKGRHPQQVLAANKQIEIELGSYLQEFRNKTNRFGLGIESAIYRLRLWGKMKATRYVANNKLRHVPVAQTALDQMAESLDHFPGK